MIREAVGVSTAKKDRSGKVTGKTIAYISGCVVWPRRSAEGDQGRIVLSGWNVKLPAGTVVPADATLVVRTKEYDLFGNVADYGKKGIIAQCRSTGQT